MNDSRYYASNKLVTQEDINNHNGIGVVIHPPNSNDTDKFLIFHHVKYNFWTIPIGKVNITDDVNGGAEQEVSEEAGILISRMNLLGTFMKTYDRGNNIMTVVNSHVFEAIDYNGIPSNMEPHKHDLMMWTDIDQIINWDLSDMTRFYICLKRQILNNPSRKTASE